MSTRRLFLLLPFAFGVFMTACGSAFAQGAFPAPLPNQSNNAASPFPPVNGGGTPARSSGSSNAGQPSPFPPVGGQQASLPASGPPPMSAGPPPMSAGPPPMSAAPPMMGMPGIAGQAEANRIQAECMTQFQPLREETEKRGKAIAAASARHAPPQEACKIIGDYSQAEDKFMKFVTLKQTACGIPPEIPKQLKAQHGKTEALLKKVCAAANAPQRAAGPTLSDVIGGPALPEAPQTKKSSGGTTFDTLNGNVLTR